MSYQKIYKSAVPSDNQQRFYLMSESEFTSISVKPETRLRLQNLKSAKRYTTYDQLISEELLSR